MTTHFITAEIDLTDHPQELPPAIEAELQKQGKPLRWAIAQVNEANRTATVEAVVTDQADHDAVVAGLTGATVNP